MIQPGTIDGGASPADDIGTLADFEPIIFSRGAKNTIDAAIALTDIDMVGKATPDSDPDYPDGYGTPKSTTLAASIGMAVQKYGQTTKHTTGQVYAINARVDVGYDSGVARFVNQIIITPGEFSDSGDSGSLIVTKSDNLDDDKIPVGLLFAGSSSMTVANPIDAVLARFGVTIDGE